MSKSQAVWLGMILVVVLVVALYVTPGFLRYKMDAPRYRIDMLTGRVQVLDNEGKWRNEW